MFRSIRTTVLAAFGLTSTLALGVMLILGVTLTRNAYQNLALRDIEFMEEQLVRALDPLAAQSKDAADFAAKAQSETKFLQTDYFKKNGMTGYAVIQDSKGITILNPNLKFGTDSNATAQGAEMIRRRAAINNNGTVFYKWQNAGESKPRDKFLIVRTLPSHPEWAVFITAYTTDDLLLPFRPIQTELIGIAAVVLILSLVIGLFFSNSIVRAIKPLRANITRMADGNLQVDERDLKTVLRRKDELGDMAKAFNQMATNVGQLIRSLVESAQAVTQTSADLSAASQQAAQASEEAAGGMSQVALGTSEQARATGEVNQTMDQLQTTIQQIASGAQTTASEVQGVAELLSRMAEELKRVASDAREMTSGAVQAAEAARNGVTVVGATIDGIGRAKTATAETAARIRELEERATRVGEITDLISDIADQTNLLALNAAIEAARAGEHGRGFAVVAEEVRKLAERAASSTKEISDLIIDIQSKTADAVRAMEIAATEVDQGSQSAGEAGEALQRILQISERSSQDAQSISTAAQEAQGSADQVVKAFDSVAAVTEENTAATEEMTAGVTQVTRSVGEVASVAQENAATAEQVASSTAQVNSSAEQVANSAKGLTRVAEDLQKQISRFRV